MTVEWSGCTIFKKNGCSMSRIFLGMFHWQRIGYYMEFILLSLEK